VEYCKICSNFIEDEPDNILHKNSRGYCLDCAIRDNDGEAILIAIKRLIADCESNASCIEALRRES
jgi:hypothetical protein